VRQRVEIGLSSGTRSHSSRKT